MRINKFISASLSAVMLCLLSSCGSEKDMSPKPVEASDPNAVTFDDGDCSFVKIICDDDYSSDGVLSVENVKGNNMLKFTDSFIHDYDKQVQKLCISAVDLLESEDLDKVHSIEFDLYADADAENLETENGEKVKAPGWIGGGGGTVTADKEKWYDFAEFSGGEYTYDFSEAVHVQFKFLLAASGQKWSNDMDDANFLIMRWGSQNNSNLYIDNIVFYDEEGNSIPTVKTAKTE